MLMTIEEAAETAKYTEGGKAVAQQADAGLMVQFYDRAVLNKAQTEIDGVARFDNVPYCKIMIPGDKTFEHDQPARDDDKRRFSAAWEAFMEGRSDAVDGTPLEQWSYLTPAQVAELKMVGFRSVEQLAAASDSQVGSIRMDGLKWRDRAQQFINGAPETERVLRGDLESANRKIADLEAKAGDVEQLRQQLAEAQAAVASLAAKVGSEDGDDNAAPKRRGKAA